MWGRRRRWVAGASEPVCGGAEELDGALRCGGDGGLSGEYGGEPGWAGRSGVDRSSISVLGTSTGIQNHPGTNAEARRRIAEVFAFRIALLFPQ